MGRVCQRNSLRMVSFLDMFNRNTPSNKGFVLITAIIILVFLSVMGMSLITYLYSRSSRSTLELDRLKAFYLAEAGISKSVYELRWDTDLDNNGVGNVLSTKLGGGTYRAIHNPQASTITGIGEYNKVKRIVQIKYSAL